MEPSLAILTSHFCIGGADFGLTPPPLPMGVLPPPKLLPLGGAGVFCRLAGSGDPGLDVGGRDSGANRSRISLL